MREADQNKKRILVVCQYYYPEPFRISDICEEMVRRGHEVQVVTGYPNYPEGILYEGYGKGKHVYPLPVGNMEIVKSHEAFGIQLADVFASALCFALTPREDKFVKYQDKIKSLPIFQNITFY